MDWYDGLRSWFQGFFGVAAAPVQAAAPELATSGGAKGVFRLAAESKGCNSTGAKNCKAGRR